MKKQILSFNNYNENLKNNLISNKERAAVKQLSNFDICIQWWPNRKSMLKTIEMQNKGMPNPSNWWPIIKEKSYI